MKNKIFLSVVFIIFCANSFAQEKHKNIFPTEEIKNIQDDAYQKISKQRNAGLYESPVVDGVLKQPILNNVLFPDQLKALKSINYLYLHDTLVIGYTPNDSLIITGTYTHNGPIFVLNDGILRFKNANATINGDITVYGNKATVTADSSTLHFPQLYIYHRALIIAGNGKVTYNNTTLDYSGLSHGLTITDSASMVVNNVTQNGFTTCGLSKKPHLTINKTNMAGEIILSDQAVVSIKNAHTALLWHHVPKTGVLDFSFPKPDTVNTYRFNKTTPGVSGINYSVSLDTCSDVMWGLMPTTGSDVKLSNSKMRTMGVWFQGKETVAVNGLVNNTTYNDFTANISDKKLHLVNTTIQTWSLYSFDTTNITITNSTLGEVGAQNFAKVTTFTSFLDGSGGYWWSTDSTVVSGFYSYSTMIRSEKNSMFIFAYSKLLLGTASAIGNSILFILQSDLPADPIPYDGSAIWMANIKSPDTSSIDKNNIINGSAWIDKTISSKLMDFAKYSVYYQKTDETDWHPLTSSKKEKRNDTLAILNTNGFVAGTYTLKLVLCDNTPDSNKMEALKSITLLPTTSVTILNKNFISEIKPNPFIDNASIDFYTVSVSEVEIIISDNCGRIIKSEKKKCFAGLNHFDINEPELTPGIYFYIIKTADSSEVKKFIKL